MWDSLLWVWASEILQCVGEFGVGLGVRDCAVCGKVWYGCERVNLCCVCDSLV